MVNQNLAPPSSAVPPDVIAFATQRGLMEVLPAVLEMTRETFPGCPLTVSFGQDAEEETHCYVALDAAVGELGVAELLAAQQAWSASLLVVCPPRQAVFFVLGWQ